MRAIKDVIHDIIHAWNEGNYSGKSEEQILREYAESIVEECSKEAAVLSAENIIAKNLKKLVYKNVMEKIH